MWGTTEIWRACEPDSDKAKAAWLAADQLLLDLLQLYRPLIQGIFFLY